ncbi:MAG: hypothetical protein JST68_27745 [Bacteroidetes bacterium]|nr:hypothetical protein [Bacteroidota bacterium]
MAKEYYSVSYKTYFNERIKPVLFNGNEVHPLYVQLTFNRKTIFFKSYYFEVFSKPKYDFLATTIDQIEELDRQAIDYVIGQREQGFDVDVFLWEYRKFGRDILDWYDSGFKIWMVEFFRGEGLDVLAELVERGKEDVAGIRLWHECKKFLAPGIFRKMEELELKCGSMYLPLAEYIRMKAPGGPFCLPAYQWMEEERRKDMDVYFHKLGCGPEMRGLLRSVGATLLGRLE